MVLSCQHASDQADTESDRYPTEFNQVLENHGGLQNWRGQRSLKYRMTQGDKEEMQEFDLNTRASLITHEDYTIGFDGTDVWVSPDKKAYRGRSARFYHNLNFYFFAMPFVLADPGVNYEMLPDATLGNKSYTVIRTYFNDQVGDAPEDEYLLYLDPTTHQLEFLLYTVTYFDGKPSDKYNALKYETWQNVDGITVPGLIRGYQYSDGKLGEERYSKVFSEVQFSKASPPASLFEMPANAEIDQLVMVESTVPAAYPLYCAGCHGASLQGGSAGTLVKEDWTYGRRKGDMRRNIKFGIKGTDMVAWGSVLNDSLIDGLVEYIYDAQSRRPDGEKSLPEVISTEKGRLQIATWIGDGLEKPWAIEFVDEQNAFVSQRQGQLLEIEGGKLNPIPVSGTPATHAVSSTGGYMDIALDPEYAISGWIYLAYSAVSEGSDVMDRDAPALTKIIRGKIIDHHWLEQQTLFQVPDSLLVVKGNRWGCRMLFDQQGYLYFTIGDMGQAMASQDLTKATGKVFRINRDGTIPADNPFVNQPGALKAIFTIGNRNVQGIAQHPQTGEIWATEHGPMGGDELNILRSGKNYGWPITTFGVDYSGEVVSDKTSLPGVVDPVYQWTPSNGICPLTFVNSSLFSNWGNSLVAGALAYEELFRLEVQNGKVMRQEMLLKGFGRVRDLKFGPDGALFVVLNNPDKIIRIVPAEPN
jgi:glucose/arabinose dehydrogenase